MNYPLHLDDFGVKDIEAEIVRLTLNNKTGGRFSKSEALHLKYDDLGSFRGQLHSAMAAAKNRLAWSEEYTMRRYPNGDHAKACRNMIERAERLYDRVTECYRALDKRWAFFQREDAKRDDHWLNPDHAREFAGRAVTRPGHECSITADDLLAIARERNPEPICPVLGMEIGRRYGGAPSDDSASLHRVDSQGGYDYGNLVFVSVRANALIRDLSSLELLAVAQRLEGERSNLYMQLSEGQARLEEMLDITPRFRNDFKVTPVEWYRWSAHEEGELYYQTEN